MTSAVRGDVSLRWRRLKQTHAHEYLIRFVFGGLVTVAAGLVGNRWGPVIGGLFLAFPSILPASLTLVKGHTRLTGAAGANALGAALGSVGLLAFALTGWQLSPEWSGWLMLLTAGLAWTVAAVASWVAFQHWHRSRRHATERATASRLQPR